MNVNASEIAAQVQESFDFSVDKFRLSGPEGMKTDLFGLFRSDNCEHVGRACKKGYVPHQTEDIVALAEAAQEAFDGDIEVECHFRDGHYVDIQPTAEKRVSVYGTADNIWPRVILRAGYDGRAFKATMGYFRDACENLAMLQTVKEATVSIRHSRNLRGQMDSLIDSFSELKNGWSDITDVVAIMEQKRVNMLDFMKELYGEPDESSKNAMTRHQNRTEAIFLRLQNEQRKTGRQLMTSSNNWEVSGWEAYNAIQGYVQHDAPGRQSHSGMFDRILRAASDKAVLEAERMLVA